MKKFFRLFFSSPKEKEQDYFGLISFFRLIDKSPSFEIIDDNTIELKCYFDRDDCSLVRFERDYNKMNIYFEAEKTKELTISLNQYIEMKRIIVRLYNERPLKFTFNFKKTMSHLIDLYNKDSE